MNTPGDAPPKTIDVLVVDDAVVVRRIVGEVLATDPDLRVIGTAANGKIAIQKLQQIRPDVVTLDFEMPEMDGLETLKAIRRTHPKLPVIMFSTLTERGAVQTLDALAAGASDYVTKPANVGSVTQAQQRIREELIPKIKSLCGVRSPQATAPGAALGPGAARARVALPARPGGITMPPEAVVIGVSTGGPNALAALLPALPKELSVPVLIVQHMPPTFTKMLAERLHKQSPLNVVEATAGMPLRPGTVYIAPGDCHLTVERQGATVVTGLNKEPHENSCRPAVDPLFRSASAVFGDRLLALVLTGMGYDGLRGAEEVRRLGGRVLTQDQASSVVWGMPGAVAEAGLADAVLPLSEMAGEIIRRCTAVSTLRKGA